MKSWKSTNKTSCAELLIEFFEFYALTFRSADMVVSLRKVSGISKEEKQWRGKKLAIEDPFAPKRNLARSIHNVTVFDFIQDCFRIGYLYFGTIQTSRGPVITKILVPDTSPERTSASPACEKPAEATAEASDILAKLNLLESDSNPNPAPPPPSAIRLEELEKSFQGNAEGGKEVVGEENTETLESFQIKFGKELTPKQAKRVAELVPKNMIRFVFDGDILTAGQSPTLTCIVCGNDGHLQTDCPEEKLPPLRPLLPLPPKYIMALNDVCQLVMENNLPSLQEINDRNHLLKSLTKHIKKFYPRAELTVYGSSHNGFAFQRSDQDISLTFSDHPTMEGLDATEIIEGLAEDLKQMPGLRNIQAITSAKVPIIKFNYFRPGIKIEGIAQLC